MLAIEGRIGLSPALLNSLAIARGRDSTADLVPVMGCSPAHEDRSGGRVRAPSLADIADKGAYTDRVGYTHPTLAVRLRPTATPADPPARLPTRLSAAHDLRTSEQAFPPLVALWRTAFGKILQKSKMDLHRRNVVKLLKHFQVFRTCHSFTRGEGTTPLTPPTRTPALPPSPP